MKLSQFRRIIKEEIKKVLNEAQGTYKNGIYTGATLYVFGINSTMVAEIEKKFGEFLKVTGPLAGSYLPVELDIKALIKFVQAGKLEYFGVYEFKNSIDLKLHPQDALSGSKKDVTIWDMSPQVLKVLMPYKTELPKTEFVTIQIAPETRDYDFESGDYGDIEDYKIPTVVQSKLAGKQPAQGADDQTMRRYVFQVRNQLTPLVKTVFPDAKFYDIGVGGISYQLTAKPDSQQKSKLKSLLKGALEIDFYQSVT